MKRSLFFAFSLSAMAACTSAIEPVDLQSSALTAEQCSYFAVNGNVQICHATSSAKNPFVIIKTDEAGCINAHEDHADDYIAYNDPTCKGLGCLPEGAPSDGTVECCEGLEARDGECVQAAVWAVQVSDTQTDPIFSSSFSITSTYDLFFAFDIPVALAGQHVAAFEISYDGAVYQRNEEPFSSGTYRVWTSMPVAGTWIEQFAMTGTWSVRVFLDGEQTPRATTTFILQ